MAAFTADDLAAIRRCIAMGERTVQFSDRLVSYRSLSELLEAERRIASELAGRPKVFYVIHDKGLGS